MSEGEEERNRIISEGRVISGDVTEVYEMSSPKDFDQFVRTQLDQKSLRIRIDVRDFDFDSMENFLNNPPLGQERVVVILATRMGFEDLIRQCEARGIRTVGLKLEEQI